MISKTGIHRRGCLIAGNQRNAHAGLLESRQSGLSFLEVVIYLGIFAVLASPLLSLVLVSTRTTEDNDTFHRMAERSRSTAHWLTREIRRAVSSSVTLTGTDRLEFTLPAGYDGSSILPGPAIRYQFMLVPDEQANSVDDNGNGLVDEGQLVRSNLNTGETAVVCQGLDLPGCRFDFNGTAVSATISNQGHIESGSSAHTLSRSLSVTPRN